MSRHVKQYLEPLLAQTQVTISEQIRRLLYGLLASRRASVDQMAERLGMNRRALHRRLAREGATFSSIFDEVRGDLALKALSEDRYRGHITISDVVANLHSCIARSGTFRINGAAFVLHRGNIKLDKIMQFLASVGVDGRLRKIVVMPTLEDFFANSDPPRNVRNIQDQDLRLLLSPIDDLVDRRNAVSHGVIDEIETIDLLLARCNFVNAFVHALYELLLDALPPLVPV